MVLARAEEMGHHVPQWFNKPLYQRVGDYFRIARHRLRTATIPQADFNDASRSHCLDLCLLRLVLVNNRI